MFLQSDWLKAIEESRLSSPSIHDWLDMGRYCVEYNLTGSAKTAFGKALALSQTSLGKYHPTTLVCTAHLARHLMNQREDRAACEILMDPYSEFLNPR
jgi:hypothetical protein